MPFLFEILRRLGERSNIWINFCVFAKYGSVCGEGDSTELHGMDLAKSGRDLLKNCRVVPHYQPSFIKILKDVAAQQRLDV